MAEIRRPDWFWILAKPDIGRFPFRIRFASQALIQQGTPARYERFTFKFQRHDLIDDPALLVVD